MTSVIGHLNGLDFDQQYRKWQSCRPGQLFDAPVVETVDPVCSHRDTAEVCSSQTIRTRGLSQRTSRNKHDMQGLYLSGPIVIGRGNI